jgi:hypothetical protein
MKANEHSNSHCQLVNPIFMERAIDAIIEVDSYMQSYYFRII